MSARQQAWAVAAVEADRAGSEVAALLFTLIAQPSAQERRGHSCVEHAQGFRRDGTMAAEHRKSLRHAQRGGDPYTSTIRKTLKRVAARKRRQRDKETACL
jgi:hypothetical protein